MNNYGFGKQLLWSLLLYLQSWTEQQLTNLLHTCKIKSSVKRNNENNQQ